MTHFPKHIKVDEYDDFNEEKFDDSDGITLPYDGVKCTYINGHRVTRSSSFHHVETVDDKAVPIYEVKYSCWNCYEGGFDRCRESVSPYVLGWFLAHDCPGEDNEHYNRTEVKLK